jgi:hypothetical protein
MVGAVCFLLLVSLTVENVLKGLHNYAALTAILFIIDKFLLNLYLGGGSPDRHTGRRAH